MRGLGRLLLVAMVLAAACSGSDDEASEGGDDDAPSVEPACEALPDERPAKAILRCHEASVAFVETELATGTGVVVDVGGELHILTNAHVVDPFDAATVVLGDETLDDVSVEGIDVAADIALLGPLDAEAAPVAIGTPRDLERGDDVFLVGYPGDAGPDDLEATIAGGIVSRVRHVDEFDQTYVQTDAAISGGQSGGPLFDAAGHLVGISGLSFAEDQFALALGGDSVRAAVSRIAGGHGDDHLAVPPYARPGAGSDHGTVSIAHGADQQVLYLPAAETARTWHLEIDTAANPLVAVNATLDFDVLAMSRDADERGRKLADDLVARFGGTADQYFIFGSFGTPPDRLEREIAPGRFEIPVEPDVSALVFIAVPTADGPVEVGWRSDLPLLPLSAPVTSERLAVGHLTDLLFGSFDTAAELLVDLEAGQEVQVHARSPQGDPAYLVIPPGATFDHLVALAPDKAGLTMVDDSDSGLYGLDAKDTLRAGSAGTYRIQVLSNDATITMVRVGVTNCARKCE